MRKREVGAMCHIEGFANRNEFTLNRGTQRLVLEIVGKCSAMDIRLDIVSRSQHVIQALCGPQLHIGWSLSR